MEPYNVSDTSYQNELVVEGYVTTELKQQQIKLSHTSRIGEQKFAPEQNAVVTVSNGRGEKITFAETSPGTYKSKAFAGTVGQTYTLTITTSGGKQYSSPAVELKKNPGISNVYATYSPTLLNGDGAFQIFLDCEDPEKKSRFYRWEFKETYEIQNPFPSDFVWLGGSNVVFRDLPVDHCWGNDSSKSVVLGTTKGLSDDKITGQKIQTIPGYSFEMRIKYSILVRQYVLDEVGYTYWKSLADVNQTQGTLFDHQPGPVRGNIMAVSDPAEVVLGYFDAGEVTTKRQFFVPNNFTKAGYVPPKYLTSCYNYIPIEVPENKISILMPQYTKDGYLITSSSGSYPDAKLLLLPKYCCDCTNVGSNIKPSFWQ
ncbi:MAG TPA: DUF4249 domain-containing protein [Cyclobacteriaceae bacterium]|nr:DUF4249 domain-containing protein [Cyclobacteriaceae bacterium]